MSKVSFTYRFLFKHGRSIEHTIVLDSTTGMYESPVAAPEEWTKLENHKCSHCPLNAKDHPHCPVAKNLSVVAKAFNAEKSYEEVTVEVDSAERSYKKRLALQDGLFGLFGLIMSTSACPYMSFLKPMARFHLPFSTMEETTARSASFYLLRQYFVAQGNGKPDFALERFGEFYENVTLVNQGIAARIKSMAKADADVNSVVSLDAFASILPMEASNKFSELGKIFS